MTNILNIDLLIVGITTATICLLGFVTFFNNRHSKTNQAFLWVAISTIATVGINYFTYNTASAVTTLWLVRLVIFFALWNALALLHFASVFPGDSFETPKFYKFLIPWVGLISILTLTPLVFSGVGSYGSSLTVGPAVALFGITCAGLLAWSLFVLVRKTIKASGEKRKSSLLILWGAGITLTLIAIFNLILPTAFAKVGFVPYLAVWWLPFIALTSYAIFKHHLFNIKIVATEGLTFVLFMVALIDVIFSGNILLRGAIFLFVLISGMFLIQSVIKEVKQRERSEELAKEVEDKNSKLNEKTVELNKELAEIERMNKYMVDRELKMVELKKENEELKRKSNQ